MNNTVKISLIIIAALFYHIALITGLVLRILYEQNPVWIICLVLLVLNNSVKSIQVTRSNNYIK